MRALRGRAAARPTRALQKALSGRAAARPTRALQKALTALRRPGEWRWRLIGRLCNGAAAACAAAAVLGLCATGYAGIPGLGRVLDPGHGAWASATAAQLPRSQVLTLRGLKGPAMISFDPHGMATVQAGRLADSMLALGYLHARFRLAQMDMERRLAEGRLSQLIGPGGLASDKFELRLGLLRAARREWAAMPKAGLAATMLTAYARGVNDYLAQAELSGQWPATYAVAGAYPAKWTPADSLAVQGYLSQQLDYTTAPLDYAVLAQSLGLARVMDWFPVGLPGPQHPYDVGPYGTRGAAGQAAGGAAAGRGSSGVGAVGRAGHSSARPSAARSSSGQPSSVQPSAAVARSAADVLALSKNLPGWQSARGSAAGSAWAVNGSKVAGGGSILAGLARIPEPLSSSWFQVAVTVPGYDVTGVSLPGMPAVVIGHNAHIAWTMTSVQNQSAFYYVERTSRSHPGDYFWRNKWLPMRTVRYAIPVRGGPARYLTVRLTVHGPVLTPTAAGGAISVDWMGDGESPDVAALVRIGAASTFRGFRAALGGWRAPALTFGYADDRGNIGAVTAGSFPIVRAGTPWLPMTGTGADDVAGFIPDSALPYSYDPPGHVIALAGQPPVGAGYPYYLGTAANDSDPLDQAAADYAELGGRGGLTAAGVVALQTDPRSELAARLLPRLLAALRHASLTPAERQAVTALRGWDRTLAPGSPAAAIWWTFWSRYLAAVFGPWWQAAAVPVGADPAGLQISARQAGLAVALEQWTLTDQKNPVFRPPGAPSGTAVSAMRAAFGAAVSELRVRQGGLPPSWTLDRLDGSPGVSAERIAVLRHGRLPMATGPWLTGRPGETGESDAALTPDTLDGGWRMIVSLGPRRGTIDAEGIYPGGQSGNPASRWYGNLALRWRNGGYLLLSSAGTAASGAIRWELLP